MQHAKRFSPSSLERSMSCIASIDHNATSPTGTIRTGNAVASYGTLGHDFAEQKLLKPRTKLKMRIGNEYEVDGFKVVFDQALFDIVEKYVEYVKSFKTKTSVMYVEERVSFTDYIYCEDDHDDSGDGFGTSDCIIIDGDHAHIIDLKTGRNEVDATNNKQGLAYALGVRERFLFDHEITKYTVHIVQPVINNYSTWSFDDDYLLEFGKELFRVSKLAVSAEASDLYNPTTKGCQWCAIRHNCKALATHAMDAISADFDNLEEYTPPNVALLTDDELGKVLPLVKLVANWVKAVEQHCTETLMAGGSVAGYKVVEGRQTKKWVNTEKLLEMLLSNEFTTEQLHESKLLTPAAMVKMLGKDDAKLVEDFIVKTSGKPTLALETDKRKAIHDVSGDFD